MLKQPLRSPRPRPGEAKRGQVPCRARRHGDLQSDFVVAWVRSTPLYSQRELLVSIGSTRLSHCPVRFRSPSVHRTTPLVIGALAGHLAINSSLGLLLHRPSEPAANSAAPPKNEKPNSNVR